MLSEISSIKRKSMNTNSLSHRLDSKSRREFQVEDKKIQELSPFKNKIKKNRIKQFQHSNHNKSKQNQSIYSKTYRSQINQKSSGKTPKNNNEMTNNSQIKKQNSLNRLRHQQVLCINCVNNELAQIKKKNQIPKIFPVKTLIQHPGQQKVIQRRKVLKENLLESLDKQIKYKKNKKIQQKKKQIKLYGSFNTPQRQSDIEYYRNILQTLYRRDLKQQIQTQKKTQQQLKKKQKQQERRMIQQQINTPMMFQPPKTRIYSIYHQTQNDIKPKNTFLMKYNQQIAKNKQLQKKKQNMLTQKKYFNNVFVDTNQQLKKQYLGECTKCTKLFPNKILSKW